MIGVIGYPMAHVMLRCAEHQSWFAKLISRCYELMNPIHADPLIKRCNESDNDVMMSMLGADVKRFHICYTNFIVNFGC